MDFPAHIRFADDGTPCVQTVREHCRNTAAYAADALSDVGLGAAGYFGGLLHDCGKMKAEFRDYLQNGGVRGSVNHTFAGVRLILESFHGGDPAQIEALSAELLAISVGGHHGLFDCVDEEHHSGFSARMEKTGIQYEESRDNFLAQCANMDELKAAFTKAHADLLPCYEKIRNLCEGDAVQCAFYLGLLSRLLLSAVIQGDRRDTATFLHCLPHASPPEDLRAFWRKYAQRVETKLAELPCDTVVNAARREISDQCAAFAAQPTGVYRLNVPTGGGKTLSSLRFALEHAALHGKRRLIFTSPLLSILEQNAQVLRSYLGDDAIILEHHSNVVQTRTDGELDTRELAVESWDAPVIITTLVQLLNTLFEGRTTAIRRFHALCGSVIVIDEVQTVPPKLLSLFHLAVNFLAAVCNATVLLCSATQPCSEASEYPLRPAPRDVVPYREAIWAPFRRTTLRDAGFRTLEEIAVFAAETLCEAQSLLVVCNRKDEAEQLYRAVKGEAEESCHLSASMCAAHRRDTLARLKTALGQGKKCFCAATQVIEAGVDISFQRVIRLTAGMDSVIQAAGRCNRNGEQAELAPVYIVTCQGEKLGRLPEIKMAKDASVELLYLFGQSPEKFDGDLFSDRAVRAYYRALYRQMAKGYQNGPTARKGVFLLDLLSCNDVYRHNEDASVSRFCMAQALKTAGNLFRVFDDAGRDLVVPYREGKTLIAELTAQKAEDPAFLAQWLRRAKPYTISVYEHQLRRLGNAVTEYGGVAVLDPDFYDAEIGLRLLKEKSEFLEV